MKPNPYASSGIPKNTPTLAEELKTVKESARKQKHEPDFMLVDSAGVIKRKFETSLRTMP